MLLNGLPVRCHGTLPPSLVQAGEGSIAVHVVEYSQRELYI
jgi:hypothetical protein